LRLKMNDKATLLRNTDKPRKSAIFRDVERIPFLGVNKSAAKAFAHNRSRHEIKQKGHDLKIASRLRLCYKNNSI
jgi:hypothetical protein